MGSQIKKRVRAVIANIAPDEDIHPVALEDAVRQYEEGLCTMNGDTCPVTIPGRAFAQLLRDRELVSFLEACNKKARHTGRCLFRWSTTGRGWRLMETTEDGAVSTVREAIGKAVNDARNR